MTLVHTIKSQKFSGATNRRKSYVPLRALYQTAGRSVSPQPGWPSPLPLAPPPEPQNVSGRFPQASSPEYSVLPSQRLSWSSNRLYIGHEALLPVFGCKSGQRCRFPNRETSDTRPPQFFEVPTAPKFLPHVVCKRADVGTG